MARVAPRSPRHSREQPAGAGLVATIALIVVLAQQLYMGPAVAGLSVALVVAFLFWVRRPPRPDWQPGRLLTVYTVGLVVQLIHFVEELTTGFARQFPALIGLDSGWSETKFATFNMAWMAVFIVAAWLIRRRRTSALLVIWFFALIALANGVLHLGASLIRGEYFPGAVTAILLLGVGAVLLGRLVENGLPLRAARSGFPADGDTNMEDFDPERLIQTAQAQLEKLPSVPDALGDLIRIAYFGSLQTEEGQPVRARLVLQPPAVEGELVLGERKRLDAKVLRKQSPAIDSERSCIIVTHQAEDGWAISGLASFPTPFNILVEYIHILVDGPARLVLTIGDASAVYDRGRYGVVDGRRRIRELLPKRAESALVEYLTQPKKGWGTPDNKEILVLPLGRGVLDVDAELWSQHRDAYVDEVSKLAGEALTGTITTLAIGARSLGHGGGMLFLPDGFDPASTETLRDATDVNPPTRPHSPWNQGLLDFIQWQAQLNLAKDGKIVVSGLADRFRGSLERWANEVLIPRSDAAAARWDSDIDRCVRLTQIDGATVFSTFLLPVAYGTTIPLPAHSGHGGHRHKSIKEAASKVPGALGVVVSQDGQITLFRAPEALDGVEVDL